MLRLAVLVLAKLSSCKVCMQTPEPSHAAALHSMASRKSGGVELLSVCPLAWPPGQACIGHTDSKADEPLSQTVCGIYMSWTAKSWAVCTASTLVLPSRLPTASSNCCSTCLRLLADSMLLSLTHPAIHHGCLLTCACACRWGSSGGCGGNSPGIFSQCRTPPTLPPPKCSCHLQRGQVRCRLVREAGIWSLPLGQASPPGIVFPLLTV